MKCLLCEDTVLNASAAAVLFASMCPVLTTVPGIEQDFKYITKSQFICCISPDFHRLGVRFLWSVK